MRVWSLLPPMPRPFDGESTSAKDGRWHRAGMRIAYASESLPAALLECLVHLDRGVDPRVNAYALDVPDESVARVDVRGLPAGWHRTPPPPSLADVTARWLAQRTHAALVVPSALVEGAFNVLIDPTHPAWNGALAPVEARPFRIDPRLLA